MKETISKVKRWPSEGEKLIANKATDKELILKIYKQFMQLNTRKNKMTQSKNGPKNLTDISLKKTYRCSTSFVVKEMQIKTTMRHRLTPVRMAAIQKSTSNKCWRGCGEKGTLFTLLVGMQTSTATMKNSVEIPLKTGNRIAI